MKEDDKSQEESNRFGGNRLGISYPTPALPEGEGARFETNEEFTANEVDSIPTKENLSEVNKPVTSIEADSIPTKENLSEVNKPVTSIEADSLPSGEGRGGVRKPGYITANPYTYPVIKDYRKTLKDHQTKAELVLWEYLRNKKNRS